MSIHYSLKEVIINLKVEPPAPKELLHNIAVWRAACCFNQSAMPFCTILSPLPPTAGEPAVAIEQTESSLGCFGTIPKILFSLQK